MVGPVTPGGRGLLGGVRVLDFGRWRPAPEATRLLAGLGADVLQVEPPGGDPMRAFPELFATLAAHKRSVVLDLQDPPGRRRALALAAEADIVVEGWRPGVAARLGVGPDDVRAVNPTVVYCSLSGYGATGPLAAAAGHDVNYQALAGALVPDGGEPTPSPRVPWADTVGGLAAAFAICAAWIGRARSGEGEVIDLAMTDVLAAMVGVSGGAARSEGPAVHAVPGYGVFRAADGAFLALGVITEQHLWDALCDGLGLDEPRGLTFEQRLARTESLQALVADAVARLPRDEAVARLLAAGAPASPVHDRRAMLRDPQLVARGTVTVDAAGRPALGFPVRFREHPARPPGPVPALDAHRDEGFAPRERWTG